MPKRVAVMMVVALAFVVLPENLSAQSSGSLKALEAAAAKGNLAAMYALGASAEASGDFEKALTHFRAAADAGYAGAEFKLGECYENGRGVAIDLAMARDWYGKAAKQGLPQAVEKLRLLEGDAAATPAVAAAPEATTPNAAVAGATAEPSPAVSPSAATTGEPRTIPPAAIQPSSPSASETGLPEASSSSSSSTLEIVAFVVIMLVALPMSIMTWRVVRGWAMGWYRSRDFLITGRNAMDMMTKEVGLRLQVEWIPLVAGFAVFVGISVGGLKLFELLFGVQI